MITKNPTYNEVLRKRKEEGQPDDPACEACFKDLRANKVFKHTQSSRWLCSGCFISGNSIAATSPRQKPPIETEEEPTDEVSRLKNKVNLLRNVLMQLLNECPEEQ